ncbi:hypothetical protein AWE51_20130 [Aquimarina aggregata]|uniref:Lipocalin-like domain-containing protein n=1 Tax=Aquimarina aggregata TaxID=1642818 RepID=A0A162DKA2_9FLAO|nr:lipocalin family protein [Aquimarina aggregata]KZS41708.1 hypothetical protein AWE51_20130 [Aquimarina aggregata]
MKILHHFAFYSLMIIISTSCSQKTNYKLPKNAKELLAGEKGKTWKISKRINEGTRMNMRGCFLSYRITYNPDGNMKDNNEEQEDCGPSLRGNWQILENKNGISYIKWTSNDIPEILNMKSNHKYFKILKLTKDTLELQHRHKQFSSKTTFIDLFVPEHSKIKNRDFHW